MLLSICYQTDDSSSVILNFTESESGVVVLNEDGVPPVRLESALECLSPYDPSQHWNHDSPPFLYWTIRDYAHAYRSKLTTPSTVS